MIEELYNVNNSNLDFNLNDEKYIYFEEKENKKGKRYDYLITNNIDVSKYSNHSPSCSKLYDLLKKINITNDDKIIDVGSGKGYALAIMNLFKFSKIAGVEIDKKLIDVCYNNFTILKINNIEIYHKDATLFEGYLEYNYFYFYNPFSLDSFSRIIDIISNKKNITIIFKNIAAEYQKLLETKKFVKIAEEEGEERNYLLFKS